MIQYVTTGSNIVTKFNVLSICEQKARAEQIRENY